MKRSQLIVSALAVLALIVVAVVTLGGDDSGDGADVPSDAQRISVVISPEKEKLLRPLVDRFNAERVDADGRPVHVDLEVTSSGEAEQKIADGSLEPVIWSPASSLWGRQLNYDADRELVPPDSPSIVRTPLVIAMWEPLAQALGWPRREIGFKDVLGLARSKAGWAQYGVPQYGAFRLGHTNPDFSTSGLSAVAAEYYAATGKREGLTTADIDRPGVRDEIRAIERSIVHYGDTTLFFADQLKKGGPGYASAVAMEEVTLVDFNRSQRGTKLVAIYPKEGTFFSDNPLIVLDAPWVDARDRAAATAFERWLLPKVTPEVAASQGFRPGSPDLKPVPPVDARNGVDPAQPTRVLSLPEPEVLARVKEAWREDRKPANIMLVVDTSGSMYEEDKLVNAQDGLRVFLRQVGAQDRVGILAFNDELYEVAPLTQVGPNRDRLLGEVDKLTPAGETAVYDATDAGVNAIRALRDDTRINAVVVLTDGEDTSSALAPEELVDRLERQAGIEGRGVRVFTIAYGEQANKDVLEEIAKASGGQAYVGDQSDIGAVYRQISSFF